MPAMTRSLARCSRRPLAVLAAGAALVLSHAVLAPSAQADEGLRAGVGQADITPPHTGYVLGGWTRSDRKANGVQTRLWAKALVLQQGDRKVALVSVNLFMVPGGWQRQVAEAVGDLGFSPSNVLISASHTHAGPGGFANFPTLNTSAPNLGMILTDVRSLSTLLTPVPADRQLYTFLLKQTAQAIRSADADLAPAQAGWGSEELYGVTKNRSLEAHLADHGIVRAPRRGTPSMDPDGPNHTIDPDVDVLRVDHVDGSGQHTPIGAWSQFSDHGTVNHSELRAYNADHHAAAMLTLERGIRAEGDVPAGRPVVDVYGNGDEGDQSAGLVDHGPAHAEEVGDAEGTAMLHAWRQAGAAMSGTLPVDVRWTQACFCGQVVDGARSSKKGVPGLPFLTGSEEGRGPLYDATHVAFEGDRWPVDAGQGQGHKIQIPVGEFPTSVPTMVVRVGDRIIASMPGEPTKEAGARVKAAVLAASSAAGVQKVVISGLANEYINYITTPQEYDAQHYEGGSTMYGRSELGLLRDSLVGLTKDLVSGRASSRGVDYDATRGITPDGAPYPAGAASGTAISQPVANVPRLTRASFSWQGGADGADRPVGDAFVRAEHLGSGGTWTQVDDDLGLAFLWRVTAAGAYTAQWEARRDLPLGTYRLVVTATRYRLASQPFQVTPSTALQVQAVSGAPAGEVAARIAYPAAKPEVDLTARPAAAVDGQISFRAASGEIVTAPITDGVARAKLPGTAAVTVAAGGATDAAGNTTATAVRIR